MYFNVSDELCKVRSAIAAAEQDVGLLWIFTFVAKAWVI